MGAASTRREYDPKTGNELPREETEDAVKAEAAAIFKAAWDEARKDPRYLEQMAAHKAKYGHAQRRRA